MFNDVEYWIKDHQQTCLANATEFTEYAKQFKLGHWCFCGPGQEKVRYRTCPNTANGAWDRIARKMTQKFEESPHPKFYCAEPFLKGDLKFKQGKQTPLSEYDSNKDRTILGMQSVMHARRSVCLAWSAQSKQRSSSSWRTGTFHRRPHEHDTPKRSNSFGRPNARQQRQQNQCSSVTRDSFLSRSWQRPVFCDQTFVKEWKKMDTGMQRAHSTPHESQFWLGMFFVW